MMKKNEILACLKANQKINAYELSIIDKDSRELFYVLDHLEINRAVKVQTIQIKVYVSDKKGTGSSTVVVTAADDARSLSAKLSKALSKAKAAKNPYYPLTEKTENLKDVNSDRKDLNEIATKAAKAVFKADVYKNGWINSTEIFVSKLREEFINSNGVDHISDRFRIEIECIPTWSNRKEEFELYKFYESNRIDYRQITAEIDEILNLAKARSNARTLKDVKVPEDLNVLVKNDMLELLVENFAMDLNYRSVFMHDNHYNKGDLISNNRFDLTMKPVIAGCAASRRFDSHGTVLRSVNLIKDGIAKNTFGDIQFGYYNNEKKISGNLPVAQVKAEGINYKKEPHLIIENFSAPQLEPDSGYWGGEVRLARYFDGKKYIPLTGFSISGNIYDDIKDVKFSKEENITARYKGPKYMIFKGLKIS
jgi:PmbA protein